MFNSNQFLGLIQRVRAGDEQAAADLVRRYEPLIRRQVRLQLEDERLARLFDSMDLCQSVVATFFFSTAVGVCDLRPPKQFPGLLVKRPGNKRGSAARQAPRQRRAYRRETSGNDDMSRLAAAGPTPSRQVAGEELLQRARQRMTEEELKIADLRADDLSWEQIAERLGGNANALRMQLARALERVVAELGLDDRAD